MSTKSTLKTESEITFENKVTTGGIMLSIEIESNFKLYSYRIITKENFIERVNELIKIYQQQEREAKAVWADSEPKLEEV